LVVRRTPQAEGLFVWAWKGAKVSEIRLAVIDNYPIFRAGLIYVLGAELDLKVVGEGASVDDALRLVREAKPSLIVLDMSIPGGGITAIESVLACCPDVKPLMLTSIVDNDQVCSAMQKGAWGYVLKGISGPELAQTVRIIHRGERYVTPALATGLFAAGPPAPTKPEADRFAGLTGREEQILALLTEGLSNKEIGGRLEISEKTVKHYLTILLDKLKVRNRVQAALLGYGRSKLARH
jgi:two-component system nitrate/nitrite response regulator NarL